MSHIPLGFHSAYRVIQSGRAAFFEPASADLPNRTTEILRRDDLTPQLGFVGAHYPQTRVLLLGINPGNGPKHAIARSPADARMMPDVAAFAENPTAENFAKAQLAQKSECQTWPLWTRHCAAIFGAGRLTMEDIAYSNCLPWRTGSESNFDDSVVRKAVALYTRPLIEELQPRVVIALGKRVQTMLDLNAYAPPNLIVWNRAQAATRAVMLEREACARQIFTLLAQHT